MTLADAFDTHLSAWKEWQETPWGRLRYSVAQTNLRRHLPAGPLCILDVAGGNGLDVLPLARDGHQITLVDFSAEMLSDARGNAEASSATERITLHHADVRNLPTLFPQPTFDVILCHNLLQYVDDVADALEKLDATSRLTPTFNVSARQYAAEEIIPLLPEMDCTLVGHYGVRCLVDYIADNDIKADPASFAQLEQLEIALSNTYPYYLLARFIHLLARKTSA